MPIDNVQYKDPILGNTTDNPLFTDTASGITESGNSTALAADMTSRQLLEGILIELKKINLRQEEVFEEQVKDGDV